MTATATRTVPAEWLRTADGGLWLAVRTETARGLSDGAGALDFVGVGSWVHGSTAYLSESDAFAWLDSVGCGEADIAGRWIARAPAGFRSVRDSSAADAAAGDDLDAVNRHFGAMADAATPPDGVTVKRFTVEGGKAPTRDERRRANRELAAAVRAAGHVPNGTAWERAKALRDAGEPITAAALA